MFIGFDYGTANCSVAVMRDGKPHLLKMENDSTLLPSMLCAPTREAVSEWLYRHHDVPADDDETQALLRRAIRYNREEDIDVTAKSVQFGLSSLAQYIDDPEEVWFVKSPKSFLGASGLKPQQVALFEDLVCAMMLHIRQQAQGTAARSDYSGGDWSSDQLPGGWAVMKQTPRRKGFWNARRSVPDSGTWYSSTSRSRLGWITKPPCRKKNGCWWWISAVVRLTVHCC